MQDIKPLFLTLKNQLVLDGEKTNTLKQIKPYQRGNKRGQIRPNKVSLLSNHKTTMMKVLKHENISLFYVIHKS